MTLETALDLYRIHRPALAKDSHRQLVIACNLLRRYTGCGTIDALSEDVLVLLANRLLTFGRAPRTVNGRIASLLTLWRFCHRKKLVRNKPADLEPLPEPRRLPRAWDSEELSRIITACSAAPTRRTWTGRHWLALVLTIYDTSLRVGCLLRIKRTALAGDMLTVPAEEQKGRVETIQRLHPETIATINSLPPSDRLFDWPYHANDLWHRFRSDVLAPSGLPCGRRDLFHKLRRTSYTQVYARLSPRAATEHAAHTCDLSRAYLDPVLLSSISKTANAIDVLPRPGQQPSASPSIDALAELVQRLNADDQAALLSIARRFAG